MTDLMLLLYTSCGLGHPAIQASKCTQLFPRFSTHHAVWMFFVLFFYKNAIACLGARAKICALFSWTRFRSLVFHSLAIFRTSRGAAPKNILLKLDIFISNKDIFYPFRWDSSEQNFWEDELITCSRFVFLDFIHKCQQMIFIAHEPCNLGNKEKKIFLSIFTYAYDTNGFSCKYWNCFHSKKQSNSLCKIYFLPKVANTALSYFFSSFDYFYSRTVLLNIASVWKQNWR